MEYSCNSYKGNCSTLILYENPRLKYNTSLPSTILYVL